MSASAAESVRSPHHAGAATVLVVALVLTGLSMRTAVTSVGSELDDLQAGLHVSSALAGLITTLPVLCFAAFGAVTPRLAARAGSHRLLVAGLALSTAGLATRPLVDAAGWFVLLSVLALSGAAMSNVLLPSLVRRHFPDRVGPMTAAYSTALAVGTTAAAGLSVPIGDVTGGGWRAGIGVWAVLTAVAVLPWLTELRGDGAAAASRSEALSAHTLLRSPVAWSLTVFFATQSMQAYIAFGWFARFLDAHGVPAGTAGAMVALYSAIGIPVSLVAPRVSPRRHRMLLAGFGVCSLASYVGLAVAPAAGAWGWMVLGGIGGGMFPVALTLIGLRSATPAGTAALSAFVQSIGYIVAGLGPLLFGALYGATGSWALPLAVLFVALAVSLAAAWPATVDRTVEGSA